MALVDNHESFYYVDQFMEPDWYRIFQYRIASYTEFLEPNALECRGHTFRISNEGPDADPEALVSLPMEKFFNLNENPMTMGLDLSNILHIWDKLDGSLISTYMTSEGVLKLKSKGSLGSDQAVASMKWLDLDAQEIFKLILYNSVKADFTVNMEWTAPDNRIVIGYENPSLRVLCVRDNTDGTYLTQETVDRIFGDLAVRELDIDTKRGREHFVSKIPDMTDVEGYVIQLPEMKIKVKTKWYLALHHTKDTINSPRRLFECILEEGIDDVRSLFFDDPLALKTIQEMEDFVADKYNHMVDSVERFYERNKHLERKEYAILGTEEFKGTFYFSLAMSKYIGRDPGYKEFLKKKWKQLGLKDKEDDDQDTD